MKKPPRALVFGVMLPLFGGCVHVQALPVPEPRERPSLAILGVVLENDERLEFERVDDAQWTDSTVVLTGQLKPGASGDGARAVTTTTRSIPLSSVQSVLVRQLDANRTSIIIGGIAVGAIATAALLLTGKADENTVLGARHRD